MWDNHYTKKNRLFFLVSFQLFCRLNLFTEEKRKAKPTNSEQTHNVNLYLPSDDIRKQFRLKRNAINDWFACFGRESANSSLFASFFLSSVEAFPPALVVIIGERKTNKICALNSAAIKSNIDMSYSRAIRPVRPARVARNERLGKSRRAVWAFGFFAASPSDTNGLR